MPNLDRLDDDRVEQALSLLASTDTKHAILSGEVKRLEEELKRVKARVFLESVGTVAERENKAVSSDLYGLAIEEYVRVWKDWKVMGNEREKNQLVIEVWRSLQANRRKGNL